MCRRHFTKLPTVRLMISHGSLIVVVPPLIRIFYSILLSILMTLQNSSLEVSKCCLLSAAAWGAEFESNVK